MSSPDLLVIGRDGQLARSLAERAPLSGIRAEHVGRPQIDLADAASIEAAISASAAPFVVNTAAYTAVDQAEREPELAWRINASAPRVIASAAAARGARLVHISTDYVFDGRGQSPYAEADQTAPLNTYGRSKLAGEMEVRSAGVDHVIVRTAWVYSPFGRNFVKTMLTLAEARPQISVVADQIGSPTSALDLADGLLRMIKSWRSDASKGAGETFHLAGTGETSWAGFAAELFEASRSAGGPGARVLPIPTRDYPTPAVRPANSRLSSEKFERTFGYRAPNWRQAVAEVVDRLVRSHSSRGSE
jgi:dTDP-4-dehydrorhamnose reductase